MSPLYLLDTNILVHSVRGSSLWKSLSQQYQLLLIEPRPLYSVVSEGELRSLAMQWSWGPHKLDQMEFILSYFDLYPIEDKKLIRFYAVIDDYCESIGHPMGKNDLWIAATAAAVQAKLLTTDRDFDHLTAFLTRDWIDPATP